MNTLVEFPALETPTKPVNDGPALLRIRRLARLAKDRLSCAPDEAALALAYCELEAIETACTEALR